MKERLIIIVLAIVSGLIITTIAFFVYQNLISSSNSAVEKRSAVNNEPERTNSLLLEVSTPIDGSLTDNRSIAVKGTTNPENIVIVSSNQEDNSGKPSSDGKFSITIDIDAGANFLIVRSIAPDGNEISREIVITYTTEEF